MSIPPLFPYQEEDVQRLIETPSMFITNEAGTGKTRTVIEAVKRHGFKRVLVLAPKSILHAAWEADIKKFGGGMQCAVAHANNRTAAFSERRQWTVTNIDAAKWITDSPFAKEFDLMVLDESTAFKNPKSIRSRSAVELRQHIPNCIAMSGTPAPNGICDVFLQMWLVDKGARLGHSYYKFRHTCCEPTSRGGFTTWSDKPGISEAVGALIADVTIRRQLKDCVGLPPHRVWTYDLELSAAHKAVYQRMKTEAIVLLKDKLVTGVNAAVLANKLLQMCSGAVYDGMGDTASIDTARYELVTQLIQEREHPCVVFFRYAHEKDALTHLWTRENMAHALIDGTVGDAARKKAVEDFQAGKLRCILCHPQSAGHGLTLTRGATTIWTGATYNLEHYLQANARINRVGQDKPTETIRISATGTLEPEVYKKLDAKDLDQSDLLEMLL